jgi:GNAT superfamily N-acetyltransferase
MQDEANSLINSNSVLLAPNGKPSNLTPEQYKLVRTPEFKAWFGDWENDPENASKIVDENGEPLVVYHGTPKGGFNVFSEKYKGVRTEHESKDVGFHFTDNKEYAKNYSLEYREKHYKTLIEVLGYIPDHMKTPNKAMTYEVFLDIKNPMIIKDARINKDIIDKAINNDGIFAYISEDTFEYVAFEPYQIKLADGTNTTFDGNNPDIRYLEGGNISCHYFKSQTGIPYYDEIIMGYNKKIKNKIVNISIDDYFKLIRDEKGTSYSKEYHLSNLSMRKDKVANIMIQMKKGVKYDMPVYDFTDGFQEGRHRLIASSNLGCKNVNIALFGNNIDDELSKLGIQYIHNPDIRFDGGGMTYRQYADSQFNEEEDRYLASDYFENFEIKKESKENYPIIKIKNGLEYRKWGNTGIKVFDNDYRVAEADMKSIQVATQYQKKGIGLELVIILKEWNPNHRFGSMTPQGFNLMGKYYDTKIANNPDIRFDGGGELGIGSLSKESLEVIDNNYNSNFGFFDFDYNKESEREDYFAWLKKFKENQFKKNLPKVIREIESDIQLKKEKEITDRKLKEFEELIIPTLGNKVLNPRLSKYQEMILLDPNATIDSIEKGFKEGRNIIDEDGSLNKIKIIESDLFLDDEINLPAFERFVENNPQYKNVFNDWKKMFNKSMELSSKDTYAFRYPSLEELEKLHSELLSLINNNPDIRYAEGGSVKKVKFDIESREGEEDRTTISINGIGEVVLTETFPEYEFLEDIGEDGLEELGVEEGDFIGKIEHLEIEDEYKGQGYAKSLMNKAIELAKEKGLMPLYLNASPMGSDGLDIDDLTRFYESFGFEVFLKQRNNNLMILKDKNNPDIRFRRGGMYEVQKKGQYNPNMRETLMSAKNLDELRKKVEEKHGTSKGFIVSKRDSSGGFRNVNFEDGGAVVPKDFFSTLIKHTNDYSLSNYGEKIVENSFAIMTTKADDSYSAKRVVAKTISGNDIDVSVRELYNVYMDGGKVNLSKYNEQNSKQLNNIVQKVDKKQNMKTKHKKKSVIDNYDLISKNDELKKIIDEKGNNKLNYSQEDLKQLRNFYSETEISNDLAIKIWGLVSKQGFYKVKSNVLVINSSTGNILNYVDDNFGHVDAINTNVTENTISHLLNNENAIRYSTDTSKTLNIYDLIIYLAKEDVDVSYLNLAESKLIQNNLFIFVCPAKFLEGDNKVKHIINEKFNVSELYWISNDSNDLVLCVLKKK